MLLTQRVCFAHNPQYHCISPCLVMPLCCFSLISGVDAACKAVWDELEKQGILNETLFIFTTDNGFYHGEHGLAGKWYPQ